MKDQVYFNFLKENKRIRYFEYFENFFEFIDFLFRNSYLGNIKYLLSVKFFDRFLRQDNE